MFVYEPTYGDELSYRGTLGHGTFLLADEQSYELPALHLELLDSGDLDNVRSEFLFALDPSNWQIVAIEGQAGGDSEMNYFVLGGEWDRVNDLTATRRQALTHPVPFPLAGAAISETSWTESSPKAEGFTLGKYEQINFTISNVTEARAEVFMEMEGIGYIFHHQGGGLYPLSIERIDENGNIEPELARTHFERGDGRYMLGPPLPSYGELESTEPLARQPDLSAADGAFPLEEALQIARTSPATADLALWLQDRPDSTIIYALMYPYSRPPIDGMRWQIQYVDPSGETYSFIVSKSNDDVTRADKTTDEVRSYAMELENWHLLKAPMSDLSAAVETFHRIHGQDRQVTYLEWDLSPYLDPRSFATNLFGSCWVVGEGGTADDLSYPKRFVTVHIHSGALHMRGELTVSGGSDTGTVRLNQEGHRYGTIACGGSSSNLDITNPFTPHALS